MHQVKTTLLVLATLLSSCVLATEGDHTSKLNNETKQQSGEPFYLVQDKVWSEYGCVLDSGSKRVNPGESTVLKIKKGCKWGGVQYKVFKASNNEDMGYLAHSFRDGTFNIEVTAPCGPSGCNFYDLSPEQNRKTQ